LKGKEAIDLNSELKSLCSKYLDTETSAVALAVLAAFFMGVINLTIKYGFYAFKSFYRF
jgi:hypothetical protein